MNLLHIANDYSGSSVYKNLVRELDNLDICQIVYTPIRNERLIDKNRIELKTDGSRIIYSHILNKLTDRILYKKKIKKIVRDIEEKIDLSKIQFIHAHTWYSDGGVAHVLSKKYNIPYIIATRSTDLSIHYKYLIHQRVFGLNILLKAEKIILIGKTQEVFFASKRWADQSIIKKIEVIPNGVDIFWINNSKNFSPEPPKKEFNFLYVGTFIKRKKLVELQKAIIELSTTNKFIFHLHIVGAGGSRNDIVLSNIKKYPKLFTYHGIVKSKNDLLAIYNKCQAFAMPSKRETFGLVYVESLLQGLPILYTKGDGIDGFYQDKIGEKVNSFRVNEIKEKLLAIAENYSSYNIPTQELNKNHNWENIAKIYKKIYQQCSSREP